MKYRDALHKRSAAQPKPAFKWLSAAEVNRQAFGGGRGSPLTFIDSRPLPALRMTDGQPVPPSRQQVKLKNRLRELGLPLFRAPGGYQADQRTLWTDYSSIRPFLYGRQNYNRAIQEERDAIDARWKALEAVARTPEDSQKLARLKSSGAVPPILLPSMKPAANHTLAWRLYPSASHRLALNFPEHIYGQPWASSSVGFANMLPWNRTESLLSQMSATREELAHLGTPTLHNFIRGGRFSGSIFDYAGNAARGYNSLVPELVPDPQNPNSDSYVLDPSEFTRMIYLNKALAAQENHSKLTNYREWKKWAEQHQTQGKEVWKRYKLSNGKPAPEAGPGSYNAEVGSDDAEWARRNVFNMGLFSPPGTNKDWSPNALLNIIQQLENKASTSHGTEQRMWRQRLESLQKDIEAALLQANNNRRRSDVMDA